MAGEYPIRIAPGTQVVAGGNGPAVVVSYSEDTPALYTVRFPSGAEQEFARDELRIRKHAQSDVLGPAQNTLSIIDGIFDQWVIYRCVTGSRAYGLDEEESDTDVRGVFVAPPDLLWSLQGAPEYLEKGQMEEAHWEVRKFCILALKANPNVLECLFSPIVLASTPAGDELLTLRDAFLSRFVHQTFNGYVMSQFKKLERDLRVAGEPKWKHVMHLIRLLLSGITLLSTGTMEVRVLDHRDRLLDIRRGQVAWEEVEDWRLKLHGQFDAALTASPLPEMPDYQRVNQFLLDVRMNSTEGTCP
jgi:uncharacterized protein